MQTNPQLELAKGYVHRTGQHVFLTGKAGTGKTTFLQNLRENPLKRMVVTAPTGVAAINAHGVTLHSFFQLPLGPLIGYDRAKAEQLKFNKEKINIIRSIDLLVIDEISMVRADLLDAVDVVLRRYRTHSKPFGGIQLLMIGDLQQLSPIVKEDERALLNAVYDTPYFFSSRVLRETSFVSIELMQVFRQQDADFIALLNRVRDNSLDRHSLDLLNQRFIPNFNPDETEGYITLCTHNAQAKRINEDKLQALPGDEYRFTATVEGIFPDYSYPVEFELVVKVGAQVMFVKNDSSPEKLFFNGKTGKITHIDEDVIFVSCPGDEEEIAVVCMDWENVKYSLKEDNNELMEDRVGVFTQYPLRLAWAITIHKSQGLTFERAIIDAQDSFAHGQVYVALSRCKTLSGIVLSRPVSARSIINDHTVKGFTEHIGRNKPDEMQLYTAEIAYQHEILTDLFRFLQLHSCCYQIEKIMNDNVGSVATPVRSLFSEMFAKIREEIEVVAEKFQVQMTRILPQQPDAEKNTELQVRIGKAAGYFSEKIQGVILDILPKADLDLDNQAVKKQLTEAVKRLENEAYIKCESLKACLDGFHLTALLHARATAAIEKTRPKASAKKGKATVTPLDSDNIAHPALFNRLRSWRMTRSTELGLPAYGVFSQKALYEMVQFLPIDRKSLLKINGIGEKKISQFGEDIIEIIRQYCEEEGLKSPDAPSL
jgi:DNA replication protein DnaC